MADVDPSYLVHLGIEHDDIQDGVKMNRVGEISRYFSQFEDGAAVMRHVALKLPRASRIDGVWEYMTMRKEHDGLMNEVSEDERKLGEKKVRMKVLRQDLERVE